MGGGVGKYVCIYSEGCSTKQYKKKSSLKTITKVEKFPEFKTKFCISNENIYYLYTFIRLIGEGYFSKVKLAYKNIEGESKKYAIKIIYKKRLDQNLRNEFLNELSILATIDHPNVIKFHETYEDDHNFYLVMEYLEGGDIFQRIRKKFNLPSDKIYKQDGTKFILNEEVLNKIELVNDLKKDYYKSLEDYIANISYKIISAINYCHTIGVVHRDIKPENILFTDKSDDSEIKIIDFGLSKKFNSSSQDLMKSFIGTPFFVAPEVIQENYDSNCDMWSIGASLYMLFSGIPPFYSNKKQDILRDIKKADPDFSQGVWKKITNDAKEFVKNLLVKNSVKRITSSQALNHKFFKNINKTIHNKEFLDVEILTNLKNFENPKKFKKIIFSSFINSLHKDELIQYNRVFNAIDLDHEGFISNFELKKAFEKLGIFLKDEEISNIINKIDYDKNGKLNYSEFLIAAINMKNSINDQILFKIFLNFDTNNLGYIDKDSIKRALIRGGQEIENLQEIINVIKEVSKDDNHKISFEEFYKIMNN